MVITVRNEEDRIRKYLTMMGSLRYWSYRETQVAIAMVLTYKKLERIKLSQDSSTDDKDRITDVIKELKKPERLSRIVEYLDMPFGTFRNYLTKLKEKGFFVQGDINPVYLDIDDISFKFNNGKPE